MPKSVKPESVRIATWRAKKRIVERFVRLVANDPEFGGELVTRWETALKAKVGLAALERIPQVHA